MTVILYDFHKKRLFWNSNTNEIVALSSNNVEEHLKLIYLDLENLKLYIENKENYLNFKDGKFTLDSHHNVNLVAAVYKNKIYFYKKGQDLYLTSKPNGRVCLDAKHIKAWELYVPICI